MKFYLTENFRIAKPSIVPQGITQYSIQPIELTIPFSQTDNIVICNIVRPDGFKTNEIYLDYVGPVDGEPGQHK